MPLIDGPNLYSQRKRGNCDPEKECYENLKMAGLYFEEFTVGQKFVHDVRRTVTETDNVLFSALTYNPAAVHIDHHYAAGTEFGKPR